jgi:thioredoxin 1
MSLRKAGIAALTGAVIIVLLTSGCTRESAEEKQSTPGESPAAVETARVKPGEQQSGTPAEAATGIDKADTPLKASGRLPRLVDLGRGTCVPCKMMAPILEELKKEYEGCAVVEVIDLREHREAAREYGIRVIPTQIFFDADGNEVWRHEGFLAKADMIAKFSEMGVPPNDN